MSEGGGAVNCTPSFPGGAKRRPENFRIVMLGSSPSLTGVTVKDLNRLHREAAKPIPVPHTLIHPAFFSASPWM
jgi:hypothetical protein